MTAPRIVVGYLIGTLGTALGILAWARRRRAEPRCLMCNDARCRGGAWCKYWPRNWSGL